MGRDSFVQSYYKLKELSGTHSPSLSMLCELLPSGEKILDACYLRNPFATSLFLSYLKNDLHSEQFIENAVAHYPSTNAYLAQLIAPTLNADKNTIFIGNGASEIIAACIQYFSINNLAIMIPTFSPYHEFCTAPKQVQFYQLEKKNNFNLDVDHYIDFLKQQSVDSIVIINPNNPTGSYIPLAVMERIVNELQHLSCIIIDESFIHFVSEDDDLNPVSHVNIANKFPNVIVIKSMSKDFGIAGIRAGYALMHESRVKRLIKAGYLWNSNCLAEYFFSLYSQAEFLNQYESLRKEYIRIIKNCFYLLDSIKNVTVYPTQANSYLLELNNMTADQLMLELLMNHGIYVRSCADKIGLQGEFVRIAVCREEDNRRWLNAINSIVER